MFELLSFCVEGLVAGGTAICGYQYIKDSGFRTHVNKLTGGLINKAGNVLGSRLAKHTAFAGANPSQKLALITGASERGHRALASQKSSLFKLTAMQETARLDRVEAEQAVASAILNVSDYRELMAAGDAQFDAAGLRAQVKRLVTLEAKLLERKNQEYVLNVMIERAQEGQGVTEEQVASLDATVLRLNAAIEAAAANNAGLTAIETNNDLVNPASVTGAAARSIVEDAFAIGLKFEDALGKPEDRIARKLENDRLLNARIAQLGLGDVLATNAGANPEAYLPRTKTQTALTGDAAAEIEPEG